MWYVVQVSTGSEEKICIQCEKYIDSDVLQSCFIPYYEEKRKINGNWSKLKKKLFPGYVFLISDDLEGLSDLLKRIIGFTKLIGTGETIVPLTEQEVCFLQRFGGDDHTVEMSEGIIVGDQIVIREGPLKGMEGLIKKIDRHKRKAWLEIEMFGRMQRVEVGLEITEKIVGVS